MTTINLAFYSAKASDIFSNKSGKFSTYTGSATTSGAALLTDNGSGTDNLTLEKTNNGENATANITIGGVTTNNISVDANLAWTLRDTVTGQTFQVIEFRINSGTHAGSYTMSEKPLIAGRSYETVNYEKSPDAAAGDPVFTYSDYVSANPPDGTVTGTSGNDLIDTNYLGDPQGETVTPGNDIVIAGAGNDTVIAGAGNDSVSGGTGNDTLIGDGATSTPGKDTISGGTGDDIIYGDNSPGVAATTSFQWSQQGIADEASVVGGLTGTTANGQIQVQMSIAQEANFTSASMETNDALFDYNSLSDTSSIEVYGGATGAGQNAAIVNLNFSAAQEGYANQVSNVTFGIFDLDEFAGQFIDQVVISAYDINNNLVAVTLTVGSTTTIAASTAANGVATATSKLGSGGAGNTNSATGFVQVSVAGPVSRIEIDYNNVLSPYGNHAIRIGDLQMTSIAQAPASGNDDLLMGDDGNDVIFGQGGNDSILGGAGNDTVYGGDGNDNIDGGIGDDRIFGDTGNDTIFGGDGNDTIDGGAGNDVLYGGAGIDSLSGGAGNDTIYGGAGNDSLSGGAGNDTLYGDAGNDSIAGGSGSDRIVLADGFGTDTIRGNEDDGNTDIDVLDGSGLTTNATVVMSAPETGTLTNGTNSATFSEIEQIITGSGNDSITGSSGADTITTGAGADRINAGAGNDQINLGVGTATDGAADVVVLQDGFGSDIVRGFDGATVNGNGTFTGIDKLDVTALFDLPLGNTARTPVRTNDVVVTDNGSGSAVLTFPNGEKITLIGISPTTANNPFYLNAIGIPMPDGTVSGTAGGDVIDASYTGDPDGDRVDGNDAILPGDAGNDDLIYGYGGNDTISAGKGHDEVYGGTGNDTIDGGYGDDTLFGGAGDDVFVDNSPEAFSTDTLYGGAGNDTFVVSDFEGTQIIYGGENAGDNDTLDFSTYVNASQGVTVTFSGDEAGTFNDGIASVNSSFAEIETIIGTNSNDTIDASSDTAGVTVFAGGGRDTIVGGSGGDSISAGAGSDVIQAGSGYDNISAGDGDDSVFLSDNFGNDTITGGEGGETNGDLISAADATQNLTLTLTGAEAGTISNGTDTVNFSEFERFETGSGDDTIIDTDDGHTLIAGAGADTIVAGGGNDVIDLGASGADGDADVVVLTNGTYFKEILSVDLPIPANGGLFTGIDTLDVSSLLDANGDPVNTNDVTVVDAGGGVTILTFPLGEQIFLSGLTFANASNPFYLNALGIPLPDGTVSGTSGDDVIDAGYTGDPDGDVVDGNDAILPGDSGNDDLIEAGAGNDSISAGAGNDEIYGGTGDDTIDGGSGDDTIFGGAGNDHIYGGTGADTIDGGADYDILDYSNSASGVNIDLTDANPESGGDAAGDVISNIEQIDGSFTGDDTIVADNSGMRIRGWGGDDTLTGGTGNDTIEAGIGNDLITFGDDFGDDSIDGGDGGETGGDILSGNNLTQDVTLTMTGAESGTISNGASTLTFAEIEQVGVGSGDDTIIGTADSHTIVAGLGADTITMGDGNDFVDLGNGSADGDADVVILTNGTYNTTLSNIDAPLANGDGTFTGVDTLDVTNLFDANGDPVDTSDALVSDDGAGNAVLTFPLGEMVTMIGISPADANNSFYLNALGIPLDDNDGIVSGTDGDDTIDAAYTGDPDGDVVDNGDALIAGEAQDDDIILAGGGNDTVIAGAGNDEIYGGDGDDSLSGGDGDDVIYGDTPAGAWFYEYYDLDPTGAPGNLADAGFNTSTAKNSAVADAVGYTSTINPAAIDATDDYAIKFTTTLTITTAGDYVFSTTSDDGSRMYIDGVEVVNNDGSHTAATASSSNIALTAGTHTIEIIYYENNADNILTATISGADTGNVATDLGSYAGLLSPSGDDILNGNAGDDTLYGGAGDDQFILDDGYGNDTILGGEVDDASVGDTINASGHTGDMTVTMSGPESGTITSGANTATFSEIEQIITGSGNDTVFGGSGSDRISTGAGNDQITFGEGDSIDGGDGDDLFVLSDSVAGPGGTINILGGSGAESAGDTLDLSGLANFKAVRDNAVDDGTGSYSGSITLTDGTILNYSEIENIICFTPGTRVATPHGARDIATLKVGDLVVTRDHGLQPIRWIQQRTVPAIGRFAPVRIRPGVVTGLESDLIVSPQHRVLFQGYRAELLFGESEVLIAAAHLVDGFQVTREETDEVTYIHMMFDEHEIVFTEGAATESFHPGEIGLSAISDPAREELFNIFPELRSDVDLYGPTARRCLKRHEAELVSTH